MAILEVQGLAKSFGKHRILDNISFSMEKGEVISIIGSSGSGKTTLLRCINFLERADEGRILVNGETVFDGKAPKQNEKDERQMRRHFGLVFQNFNLFPQYTALQNVMLAPNLLSPGKEREVRERAEQLLSQVGLSDKAGYYPYALSGGQQQRVAIARALAMPWVRTELSCWTTMVTEFAATKVLPICPMTMATALLPRARSASLIRTGTLMRIYSGRRSPQRMRVSFRR